MALTPSQKLRYVQYEKTVMDFSIDGGSFFIISNDATFIRTLRNFLSKDLAIKPEHILTMSEESKFISEMKTPMYRDQKKLILIERILHGKSTTSFIKQVKGLFNDAQVIVVTEEVEKSVLVLLHEIGADSFITKPFSMNTMVEKIAFTIKPQGKIGELIDAARRFLEQKKLPETVKLCRKILELKPGSAAGLMILGDAFKIMGKTDKAVAAYGEAADNAPMYLEPLKKLAILYKEEGDLGQQLSYLEKLDRLSPLNVERKVDMGELHVGFGNQEKAEQLFDEAVKHATKEANDLIEDVKRNIAEKCIEKNPALSEKFFRSILDSKKSGYSKRDMEVFNRLGISLRRQGRWQAAVEEYKKALKVSPKDENLHFNMAMAYSDGGRSFDAKKTIDAILKLNPEFADKSPVLAFNIGVIYYNGNEPQKAIIYLKKALEKNPNHKGALRMVASAEKMLAHS